MKKMDTICVIGTIFVTVLLVIFANLKLQQQKIAYTSIDFSTGIRSDQIYSERHWKNKISKTCMHCLHGCFMTKHWDKGNLYCENCKSAHTKKLTLHYMYDKALTCMSCGHEDIIPKVHDRSKINCANCKMEHTNHYILKYEK